MKHLLKISGLFLAFLFSTEMLNAQTTAKKASPPSDASSGYTYDFDKVMNLMTERITAPAKSNAIAQTLLDAADFPAAPSNKVIDANYKGQLKTWMEKNPDLIINTLKSRKDIVTQF
jgi:hypothetical protein